MTEMTVFKNKTKSSKLVYNITIKMLNYNINLILTIRILNFNLNNEQEPIAGEVKT